MSQKFKIYKENSFSNSYRNNSIITQFDLKVKDKIKEEFNFDFNLPKNWKLGVIVGNSGTGKTTIAKEIFNLKKINNNKDNSKSILDLFNDNINLSEITKILTQVGFASPKSWLKPYNVLSNGEKMRVDLALEILSDKKQIVFDEFTSVVDRDVAKTMCHIINKIIKNTDKQFILVSCHFDILHFLDTNWIFNTNKMLIEAGQKKRYTRELKLYESTRNNWKLFSKYHYLDHNLSNRAICFTAYLDNNPVGFIAIIHFPSPKIGLTYRVHRLVVLPDFQGIGVGKFILNNVANIFFLKNKYFYLSSSSLAVKEALKKDNNWKLIRKSISKNNNSKHPDFKRGSSKKTMRTGILTFSFRYWKLDNAKNINYN